jgi:hypothetical protein
MWRHILVVLAAGWLAAVGEAEEYGNGQDKIIARIEKLGGLVYVDKGRPGIPIWAVILDDTKVTDAWLATLEDLPTLERLDLDNTTVSDAGLKHLARMKALRRLCLVHTRVTETGVKMIKKALPECKVVR